MSEAFKLRPYQRRAIAAIFASWHSGNKTALVEMACGTGKSYVAAGIAQRFLEAYGDRILCIAPTKELVLQNVEKMRAASYFRNVGIHCEGIEGRRDTDETVIVGTIQSIANTGAEAFAGVGLIIADEAHLITHDDVGVYKSFIQAMSDGHDRLRVAGLTATPFRTKDGAIYEGAGALFEAEPVFTYREKDAIADDVLVPLVSKGGLDKIMTDGVPIIAGEFSRAKLAENATGEQIVQSAVSEIVRYGAGRQSWLVFCINLAHAKLVFGEMRRRMVDAAMITGGTSDDERDKIVDRFRRGELRCLVNVDVFSHGLDVPRIDMVAMLRPTNSLINFVQWRGRGTRPSPETGKVDCLVLDFGRNTERFSAFAPEVQDTLLDGGSGDPVEQPEAIECPACHTYNRPRRFECIECGAVLPGAVTHTAAASDLDAIAGITRAWKNVVSTEVEVVVDPQVPGGRYLRVMYLCEDQRKAEERIYFDAEAGRLADIASGWWSNVVATRMVRPFSSKAAAKWIQSGLVRLPSRVLVVVKPGSVDIVSPDFTRGFR